MIPEQKHTMQGSIASEEIDIAKSFHGLFFEDFHALFRF